MRQETIFFRAAGYGRRLCIGFFWVLCTSLALSVPVSVLAYSSRPDVDHIHLSADNVRGQVWAAERITSTTPLSWSRCWVEQANLPPSHAAAAAVLLSPDNLVTHVGLRIPERLARTTVYAAGSSGAALAGALGNSQIPIWRVRTLADMGLGRAGETLATPDELRACLPYPVRAMTMTTQPLVRGQTAALVIETDQVAFCRATYLDQTERCYRDGETRLIVLVAVSALAEPGNYALDIELVSGGQELTFSLPLEVAPGHYGFQYIDPPPSLAGLMDAELMASEAVYLARWRGIRSMTRRWNLPLSSPLGQPMPISADYGDRRSYGGMVDGYHSGVDYRAWTGLPVISPADGVVVMAETLETRGNAVLIDHGWGLVTGYWHLSKVHVQVGDVVTRGERFAEVGNTGLSTGAHLHWEVWVNGVSVDGKQWLDPDALAGIALQPYEGLENLIRKMPAD